MERFKRGVKEWIRKRVVYIKRHPQFIPMMFLVLACVVFTFNMSVHTTSTMQMVTNDAIALNMFIVTLCSFLSVISFMGFKGYNEKKSLFAGLIAIGMSVLQIALQIYYLIVCNNGIYSGKVKIIQEIYTSMDLTVVHIVFLGLFLIAMALLPVYARLLQKIKTTAPEQQRLQGMAIENDDDLVIEDI